VNTFPRIPPVDHAVADRDTRPPAPQTRPLTPESEPLRRWELLRGYFARSGEHAGPSAGLGVYAPETSAPIQEASEFGDNPEATK